MPHHDVTPHEWTHHEDPHHATAIHGEDRHPFAHAEQGYWELKGHEPHLGDHGHYAGEEHGEYHYLDRHVDGHHGTYYSYGDEQEYSPAHAADYHDTHGIEHFPDDWITDVDHHDSHHPYYSRDHYAGHHGDAHHLEGHDFAHHDTGHPSYAGDLYNHDSEYHFGADMKHDIEHSYDQLFHDIERDLHHGVEHHDVETATFHSRHDDHPHDVDYHYDSPHHESHYDVHPYTHVTGHEHADLHHEGHNVHTDMDLHKETPAPKAAPQKVGEKKAEEKKPEKKAAEIPSKTLAARDDHHLLHHNGSTGRFVQ